MNRSISDKPVGSDHSRENFISEVIGAAAILDPLCESQLFEAMLKIDRRNFLAANCSQRAEQDIDLPIGQDRFSPSPSFVARTLGLAQIEKGDRVLELGAGSGYASAIISSLGAQLFSQEPAPLIAQTCRKRLDQHGYSGVVVKAGDGAKGWSEYAPFNVIISWIPFPKLPEALLTQLSIHGGRLVGSWGSDQIFLHCVTKNRSERKVFRFEKVDLPLYTRSQ